VAIVIYVNHYDRYQNGRAVVQRPRTAEGTLAKENPGDQVQ
jgi:hypothetical protein